MCSGVPTIRLQPRRYSGIAASKSASACGATCRHLATCWSHKQVFHVISASGNETSTRASSLTGACQARAYVVGQTALRYNFMPMGGGTVCLVGCNQDLEPPKVYIYLSRPHQGLVVNDLALYTMSLELIYILLHVSALSVPSANSSCLLSVRQFKWTFQVRNIGICFA